MAQETKEINFESAMKKLEEIVRDLENGDLSLEEALKHYEEGVKLADLCSKRLTEAEKRVEVLVKLAGDRFKTVSLEAESAEASSKGKKKK